MAGFEGYFTKGLASGLQSGVNMGMQLTQLKWQKKKQKELDDLNAKMNDTWNGIGQELISLANDGQLSDDDLLKIHTLTIAAPYEMQSVMQNLRSSLSQLKTKDFETQMEYVNAFYEYGQGLNAKDIDSMYEGFRNYITNPHAKILYEVADKRLRHEYEVGQELEPWKKAEILPQEIRPEYLRGQGVPGIPEGTPETATMADEKSAITILKLFVNASPETFEKKKADLEESKGLDLSAYTQDILRESGSELANLYDTPEEVLANVKAPAGSGLMVVPARDSKTGKYYGTFQKKTTTPTPGTTPIAFQTLQNIKDSFKSVKTRAEYDEALASYNSSKEAKASDWTPPLFENQLTDLIKRVETAIWADFVNKDGKLKGKNTIDKDSGLSIWELYNTRLQYYLKIIEEARNAGIDVSQFQAFIPYKSSGFLGMGNMSVTAESW